MRSGYLPGQQRALRRAFKKADAFDHFRGRTRRSFLAIAALGLTGTAGGFWLGRRGGTDTRTGGEQDAETRDPKLELARRLALASDAELRANAAMFLVLLDGTLGDDALLWAGFGRLANLATNAEPDPRLAARLLATARHLSPPPWLSPHVRRLEAVVR